jgi:hypothetical protein
MYLRHKLPMKFLVASIPEKRQDKCLVDEEGAHTNVDI